MPAPFLLSIEQECLTALKRPDHPRAPGRTVGRFLRLMRDLAPSLPGGSGFFNAYGRVYVDCQHIELAAMESESPYLLARVVEQQQRLAAEASSRLARMGCDLVLLNNNHSELLHESAPTWGSHENYLVEEHPRTFTARILPFLATRVYGGAGAVQWPTGNFLAGVRPLFMVRSSGGGATENRAIHSTARDEHLMGPRSRLYRYHLILGDGHRSQFNLALQCGATALALKAILWDWDLPRRLLDLGVPGTPWLRALRQFNLLARPGRPPRVHPRALAIQRLYLDSAERYAASLSLPPAWVPRLLQDWRETLRALESDDRAWLAARLDAFIKHELYSGFLVRSGHSWKDLKGNQGLFSELALLDHSYHAFCREDSVFSELDRAGLLAHRVVEPLDPGAEPEPHVPETRTRARTRARFIREHQGNNNLFMDWSRVVDPNGARMRELLDPFAADYGPWRPFV